MKKNLSDRAFKKILIRLPNWIGDLVMATPLLHDLRKRYPEAEIVAMCLLPFHTLLEKDPNIDELFSFTRVRGALRRIKQRNICEKIREGAFDLGILCTNSFSSAWWFSQGEVPIRIGYEGHFRRWLLNCPLSVSKQEEHQVITYKRLLEPLGIPISTTSPQLHITQEEKDQAQHFLSQLLQTKNVPILGVHASAAYGSAKCWPLEKFQKTLKMLLEKKPELHILLFGTEKDKEEMQQLSQQVGDRVYNLAGRTSLRELMAILSQISVFLTNDSGPMHIADALKLPLVALFGSTNPTKTGPYNQMQSVIYKGVTCSPCYRRTCPIDFICMQQITEEEVVAKILHRLSSQNQEKGNINHMRE